MFDLLTQYLFETRELAMHGLGVFTIANRSAAADISTHTIQAPGWDVFFRSDKNAVEALSNEDLYGWLATKQNTSRENAKQQFDSFVNNLESRLYNGESIEWPHIGTLQEGEDGVIFIPHNPIASPFKPVQARKVIRNNPDYQTLVGDKETTATAMREQLSGTEPVERSSNKLLWLLLIAALAFLVVYFMNNGCNTSAIGNKQKVEVTKPGDTYKLK